MAVREGAWDCPLCGRKRNRGPDKICVGCGKPRDVSVPFYLPEDAAEVTSAAALTAARSGPDWTCTQCSHANGGDAQFCGNCGMDRRDLAMARTASVVPVGVATPVPRRNRGCWGCSIGCFGAILLFLLLLWAGRPVERGLTVSGHEWKRVVNTEVFTTVVEDAWEGEVPRGVRLRSRRREVHHVNKLPDGYTTRQVTRQVPNGTRKVKTGTRDNGNGYFEDVFREETVYKTVTETVREPRYRDDPVYRMKHVYEIEKWIPSQQAIGTGQNLAPVWPALARGTRETSRTETFIVHFRDDAGTDYTLDTYNEGQWRALQDGQKVKAKVQGRHVNEVLP